jgi:hypothetical protein
VFSEIKRRWIVRAGRSCHKTAFAETSTPETTHSGVIADNANFRGASSNAISGLDRDEKRAPAMDWHRLPFGLVRRLLPAGHNRPRYSKREIAFRGLTTCANDDCMLTGDVQKQRHV